MITDDFMTLAELTIALGGFTAVVLVLGKESRSSISDWRIFGLTRGILEMCLLIIFFCLLPVVLTKFTFTEEQTIMWSSGSHAIVLMLHGVLFASLVVLGKASDTPAKGLAPFADMPYFAPIAGVSGLFLGSGVQALNTVGYFGGKPSVGLYFGFMVFSFLILFGGFIWLLWDLIQDEVET